MRICASTILLPPALALLAGCSGPPDSERTAAPGGTADRRAPIDSIAATGERIYNNTCVACHQENGAGIPGVYPSLVGSPVLLGDPATLARWVIRGERPAAMPAGRFATQMPHFGWLTPPDAAALFNYLRSSFGNSAPPVYADVVAKAIHP